MNEDFASRLHRVKELEDAYDRATTVLFHTVNTEYSFRDAGCEPSDERIKEALKAANDAREEWSKAVQDLRK